MGPVIDKEAYDRIIATIEKNKKQSKVLAQADAPVDGYFVPPTVFVDVPWDSELAQEEIFGPVVAVIRAKDLDDALKIANSTQYALTGGLYSRSPLNIERIKSEYECGNLYINRGITGAMVGRHPFGGHKLSGLGSKTGGKDYLVQHMEPRVVTENTLRRGFAPAETE
jgi:RHH-type proline utilization regulon transcriptional repressor/proline dehydrogenase/delta 1-pyrroline-5-carboxylate dehydrogenase